jgi:hypothetical protein
MKLYYKIWVDGIVKLRSRPQNAGLWKFFAMTFTSMAMALNLVFVLFIMSDLGMTDGIFKVPVNLFPGTHIDAFFSFFISYLLPFLLMNYFLIFHRDRYKELIMRYPYHGGKLYLRYFLGSLSVFLIYIIIAVLISK